MTKSILLLIALAGLAQAQQGTVTGPVAGFVFDASSQALRPVLGVAGAATVGGPIASVYKLTAGYVAPHLDSAFGVAADGSTHYFTLSGASLTEAAVQGVLSQPERVAFSPSGTAAVLYANGQAQMVTGLPGAPVVAGSVPLRQGAKAIHPTSMAVSDDGLYLLFAVAGSIQLGSQSGGVRGVMTAGAGASVAFAPGGHDGAVAARGTGLMLIHDIPGSAAQQSLTADDGSFSVVAGLAFSTDGKRVLAASVTSQSVVNLDLSGNRADIACNCSPTELTPMGALFRLNELSSAPLWLADLGSGTGSNASGPRTVFVPALQAAQ